MSRAPSSARWALLAVLALARSAPAQIGQLVSPGPLTKAHEKLEGLSGCEKCHTKGKQVSARKCLACHEPVAQRIAKGVGVHRDVKDDCVTCHVEHMGRDAELRPFDAKTFDHAKATGFALAGKHAPLAQDCAKCHKTRSFLTAKPQCASCHQDVHKGILGADCASCHAVTVAFKETRKGFDHSRAAFRLDGAHLKVDCAKCHLNNQWRGLKFAGCADCHKDPHRVALGICADCHTTASWKTRKIEHAKTGMALVGRHAAVACEKCHVQPAVKVRVKPAPCAACHADVHKGAFKQDCAACHKETGWKGAPFAHDTRTKFALTGRHAELACASCHKNVKAAASARDVTSRSVDFRGLKTPCASCHQDVHKGQLGASCESCHGTRTFKLKEFQHPRLPELFAGRHAKVACEGCHKPAATVAARRFRGLATACASCHADPHLGQLGAKCESCHSVALPEGAPKFAAAAFRHSAAAFALTGKHEPLPCAKCHKQETAAFPAGKGTAVRYRGLSLECRACHKDVHLGQVGNRCETCHTTATFEVKAFQHKDAGFFRGKHGETACAKCHKMEEAVFAAGKGRAVRLTGFGGCASCHEDPHKGSLGSRCASCHGVEQAFRTASRAFHKSYAFPLEGKHLSVPCASCHVKGATKGTPTRCYDCHWVRRQDDPYRTRLGVDCGSCHRPSAWDAVQWDHGARTGVVLAGAHRSLACERCHQGGVFRGDAAAGHPGAMDCWSCHRPAYEATRAPNHAAAGFPTTCVPCHQASDADWHGARFDHTSYPLLGVHATQACATCHKGGVYKGTPNQCVSCHQSDYQSSANPNHAQVGFSTACASCHKASDATWHQAKFDHASVFPLVGVHATQACQTCHRNGVYKGTPSDCAGCHTPDYQKTANPNHQLAAFSTRCDSCHGASDPTWHQGRFTHASFVPAGVHATQPCASCHKTGVFKGTSTDCFSCHQPDYQSSANPNHAQVGFPTACATCHKASDANWHQGKFDHATVFPLVGVHATQPCATCHKNGVYKGTPSDCATCHAQDFQKSANPSHTAAGFATACATCHNASDPTWHQGRYTHQSYAPAGVHATQACMTCHKANVFRGTSTDCASCHMPDYQSSANPNHAQVGFPTTCATCHKASDATWHQGVFAHATIYPLVGVHATQQCAACHKNGVYKGTPTDCAGCHTTDYQKTTSPNHQLAAFSTRCDSCHNNADPTWHQGRYTHQAYTPVGVHATQACVACHKTNVFKGTSTDCFSCHQPDYQSSANPNHAQVGFPTTCTTCHKAADATWHQGVFAHNTIYPLVGVHATQQCGACHKNGVYKGTPTDCAGCHTADYQKSANPNHLLAGFSTRCDSCHNNSDPTWHQGRYTHQAYRPVGVHATQPCAACHATGVFRGTSTDCYACHQANYQRTTNPNHVQAGFPTTCATCHKASDATWQQGVFNHSTIYPLVGVHAQQPCAACHKNGVYPGTPTTCVGCHLTDYQKTTNPNHAAAGFPTTCDTCHKATDTSWNQGTFNHTWFPIASGRHSGNPCSACHTSPSNYAVFTCLTCHDRARTDSQHQGRAGYRYDSQACYSCHPQGRAG